MKNDTKTRRTPSGRFLLRIEPGLHACLREAAREAGLSLNDYCARKLAQGGGTIAGDGLREAVARATQLFGENLIGVAAFGSWARGELVASSDVDLLVVVDRRVPLARKLYRVWDERPVTWDGHAVEPQIVHLPADEEIVAGIWAEVALDGIVLFERALRLSARLVRVRRDIVAGRVIRRVVHGHPYWVRVDVA